MTVNDVRERAGAAREFLQVAEEQFAYTVGPEPSAAAQVSASNSILAGIAASDALCGRVLGVRASDGAHAAAADLLATVLPQGRLLAVKLRRLLRDKSQLQYGTYCTPARASEMLRHARSC
ncbi:hypothetical protein GCM10025780_15700 [Frondihabitans cladoniiphilus]|uniref:HEPN domain-containing protein n=1 Tax=Frondihabitans cladoniiphilus TaxID=715785 RepID=A0ABP8VWH0_9MICO